MQAIAATLQQGCEKRYLTAVENLTQTWRWRLALDCPEQTAATRESIVLWLLGCDLGQIERSSPTRMEIVQQGMAYRYSILRQRYLGQSPEQAYRHLINRLGSLVVLRQKIHAWIDLSRDRTSTVVDVLQEVIQDLLQRDHYMQQQMTWNAQCTSDRRLQNALLLASTEEYCLRSVRHQPLLLYRFVNYMRRTSNGGVTQVPKRNLLRLVFEDIASEDNDNTFSFLATSALAQYQHEQVLVEQQTLYTALTQEFSRYLDRKLGPIAVQWLQLYLQGHSQQAIAKNLNLPVKEVYRLREKVCYHAVRVFARKQPQLVSSCLEN